MKHKIHLKPFIAASLGNALEWYDFGLFGYLAITLQELFFPNESPVKGLLAIFLIFGAGMFMRPIGGTVFGYIGDKMGRKTALIVSIITMAIPTCLIGFLPTYSQVGIWAIVLLVLLRILQGLSVGGEFIGSMIFLAEYSPIKNRGFFSSLVYCLGTVGGLLGALSGAAIHALFTEQQILAWAWRLPFFIGIIIGGVGLYIRLKIAESPMFVKLVQVKKTAKEPFQEAWKMHYKEIIVIFFLISFQSVSFYLPFVYLVTWLIKEVHFSSYSSLMLNSIGHFFLICTIPLFAVLSDRIGRRKVLVAGCLLACIFSYPLFAGLSSVKESSSPFLLAVLGLFGFSSMIASYQGPLAATLAELLPTKNRFMSLVIGYNISSAIFGGITPYFSTYLVAKTGIVEAPSFLLILTGLLALSVLLFGVKETYRLPLK